MESLANVENAKKTLMGEISGLRSQANPAMDGVDLSPMCVSLEKQGQHWRSETVRLRMEIHAMERDLNSAFDRILKPSDLEWGRKNLKKLHLFGICGSEEALEFEWPRARDLEGLEFTKDLRITHIKALTSVYKFKGL